MNLYLVTDRQALSIEDFLHIILLAVHGGVTAVQLREKNASARETISIGKKLLSLLKPLKVPLIINDRVDIAHAIQADGVHLGQSDLTVTEAKRILGPKAIIGLSVETFEEAHEAELEDVDYLAASTVFYSPTKATARKPWGLEGLKNLCKPSRHPIIGIGGINEANAKQIIDSGAVGVAIVSAIFNAPCPKTAAKRIKDAISKQG